MDEFVVKEAPGFFSYFLAGGLGPMSILSIILVFLLFAAWKAPNWVKEIGLIALAFGLIWPLLPLFQCLDALANVAAARGNGITGVFDLISPTVVFGIRYTLIPAIYGMCIYVVSLIIRIILKPRL
jgi:hypothetical protein